MSNLLPCGVSVTSDAASDVAKATDAAAWAEQLEVGLSCLLLACSTGSWARVFSASATLWFRRRMPSSFCGSTFFVDLSPASKDGNMDLRLALAPTLSIEAVWPTSFSISYRVWNNS
eukprot:CAMPEP_0204152664 /NCGR_PEP_ID=MMETSP0361-20130328/27205_1 /ASSEMBLY_ACC=CAM_ASM_000343 /TAXON_ID=268821 /ORGANISM="Scrippsiella Hangoei, Strain SHTV-5" /LENGTH=116 /DNA_ID=CAMNT_0051107659 /DNA_START=546 /DNA_END=892 /DNA_ORIENTATION=+